MTDTKTSSSGGLFDLLTEEGTYGVDLSVHFFFLNFVKFTLVTNHIHREKGAFNVV